MTLPPKSLLHTVERALSDALGIADSIVEAEAVSGGDINRAARLTSSGGRWFFLKWNDDAPPGMFDAEADGLRALVEAAGPDLQVPSPHATGSDDGVSWLAMEFVGRSLPDRPRSSADAGASDAAWTVRLGRGLAALHRASRSTAPGWHRDNFIGSLPQSNAAAADWPSFWRDRRIGPQVRRAADAGLIIGTDRDPLDRLLDRMEEALEGADADGSSLLHGDLWGGNAMAASDGRAAIYDPAVYRGHREVDLAMSELFGFPAGFMPAYRESWPVDELYDVRRRDLYQLYYLLVHVNLFGRSYVAGSVAAARRVLATL